MPHPTEVAAITRRQNPTGTQFGNDEGHHRPWCHMNQDVVAWLDKATPAYWRLRTTRSCSASCGWSTAIYPFETFTESAKRALTMAHEEAERFHHAYVGTEYLLVGLLIDGEGVAAHILDDLGANLATVREQLPMMSVNGKGELTHDTGPLATSPTNSTCSGPSPAGGG